MIFFFLNESFRIGSLFVCCRSLLRTLKGFHRQPKNLCITVCKGEKVATGINMIHWHCILLCCFSLCLPVDCSGEQVYSRVLLLCVTQEYRIHAHTHSLKNLNEFFLLQKVKEVLLFLHKSNVLCIAFTACIIHYSLFYTLFLSQNLSNILIFCFINYMYTCWTGNVDKM